MPASYSLDLRKKVLTAWQNKEGSQQNLAKRFDVSLSFVRDLLRLYRQTNDITPKLQGGDRRSKLKSKDMELLQTMVTQQNDIYLREIQSTLEQNQGIKVSVSSLSRTLKRLKLGRKKKL